LGYGVRCVRDKEDGYVEGSTVTDIDGNVYPTATIGAEIWMLKNLRTTRYNDGTPIIYEPGAFTSHTDGVYSRYSNSELVE
jgi:hypothetical protein